MTYLEKILLIWMVGSVVLTVGLACLLGEREDVEEVLREQVYAEMRATWWNN